MNDNLHQLRCFGCGVRISGTEAQPDFRCAECGDLFEVFYPGWQTSKGAKATGLDAQHLKQLWLDQERSSGKSSGDAHRRRWIIRACGDFANCCLFLITSAMS